jgi:hypothetical protein
VPEFIVPTNATLHAAKSLLASAQHAFDDSSKEAVLLFHPGWVHTEPIALAMMAAWGTWAKREGTICAPKISANTPLTRRECASSSYSASILIPASKSTRRPAGFYR